MIDDYLADQQTLDGFVAERRRKNLQSPMTVPDYDPKDVAKVMEVNNRLRVWGRSERPKTNEAIEKRIDDYLFYCQDCGIKPTVEGLGLALGYTRMTLSYWRRGIYCDQERADIINYAFDLLASFDADMVINGRMPPVPYIFRSKNYYDMRDQTDLVVTPTNPLAEARSAEEIAEQYSFLPEE